ncbi:hypothetical protein [Kurthia zopfii]|uniref:hypothetical protein n=1 Tax=Kurthia zopfii TaxID=1650 RepID=UPI000F71AD4F|nr:hypothetical protein [Kurthia zopfii]VEI08113.1 Uncharacterised protein [Kurthia zopfii]
MIKINYKALYVCSIISAIGGIAMMFNSIALGNFFYVGASNIERIDYAATYAMYQRNFVILGSMLVGVGLLVPIATYFVTALTTQKSEER